MYRIYETKEYARELDELDADGLVRQRLMRGLYNILARTPREFRYSPAVAMWVVRQAIVPGLLLVQVYYRINEDRQEVELISIVSVDIIHGL